MSALGKRRKHIVLAIGIPAAIVAFIALVIIGLNFIANTSMHNLMTANIPITGQPNSFPDTAAVYTDNPPFFYGNRSGIYYPTTDEALKHSTYLDTDATKGVTRDTDEIFRFEDSDAATVFYIGHNDDGRALLMGYIFDKNSAGEYSELQYIQYDLLDPNEIGTFTFQPDEAVANRIVSEAIIWRIYARANNDQPTYIGVCDDASAYNLRILGKAPTKVIPTDYDGHTYYIWYYIGTDFRQALLDDSDFKFGNFTMGQVIDILDINFNGGQ